MTFHLETLAAAAFTVSVALVLAFTAMGAFLGDQPGLRKWIQALWLLAGATVLLGLRGAVLDAVPVVAGNGLVCLGNAFTWLGVREFCGRPGRRRVSVAGILAVFLGIQALFLWGWPSIEIRTLNVIVTCSLWSLATAWTLHRHAPKGLAASTRLVSILFLADACLGAGFFAAGLMAARPGHESLLHGMHIAQYFVALMLGPFESLGLAILLSHRLVEELRRTARTDGLTGLLTRRTLDAEAEKLLRTCRRQGIPCGILMADLDHFKDFNDAHGHGGGDAALRHFAALAGSQLRPSDLFGRYGGEGSASFCREPTSPRRSSPANGCGSCSRGNRWRGMGRPFPSRSASEWPSTRVTAPRTIPPSSPRRTRPCTAPRPKAGTR
nr:GGDEF domain-containing protein [Geothrix sp. 21YS21S-4]